MKKQFPTMLEHPENSEIVSSLIYSFFAFFSIPFILLLFMQGSFGNAKTTGIIEMVYHVINFTVAVYIYRTYLVDSFELVLDDVKLFMRTISKSVPLVFLAAMIPYRLFASAQNVMAISAYGALPLAEMELFTISGNLIVISPVWGTICMVILAPIAVSCLYYAPVFAPICCTRPVLAYLVTALYLAFPRLCNGLTYWDPAEEAVLYITQLPLHLIACWSYQKTDSIWAPIATHMVMNLLTCLMIFLGM